MTMNNSVTVTLPRGFWVDGVCYRGAGLRPLCGHDEAFFYEEGRYLLPAQRVSILLTRCLTHLGPIDLVTMEAVRSLTVGDREALLLHLRCLTLGNRLRCVLSCPNSECGEKMEMELAVNDLLMPPYADTREYYELTLTENGSSYQVRFRLPTGADQEAAARLAHRNLRAAAGLLLRRCVESVAAEDTGSQHLDDLPSTVVKWLSATMAQLDPQAELELNVTCPACGHQFSTLFDTATYFFNELANRTKHLYREVHLLAFYYHWSEAEILGMKAQKRRLYLGLLEETLTKGRIP